ncbi:hypothetical protein DIPPA_56297, partial [Diplonema papillatum]
MKLLLCLGLVVAVGAVVPNATGAPDTLAPPTVSPPTLAPTGAPATSAPPTLVPTTLSPSAAVNPYEAHTKWYVNPVRVADIQAIIDVTDDWGSRLAMNQSMYNATGFWLDRTEKIFGDNASSLEGVLKDASSQAEIPLVTIVLHNLPHRDCDWTISPAEFCTHFRFGRCDDPKWAPDSAADCKAAIGEYHDKFLNPVVDLLRQYANVPVAIVFEPWTLAMLNMTYSAQKRCSANTTKNCYFGGTESGVKLLAAQVPRATIYLDIGDGWMMNRDKLKAFRDSVLDMGIMDLIRGFSVSIGHVQYMGTRDCSAFGVCLSPQTNSDRCCRQSGSYEISRFPSPYHNMAYYILDLKNTFPDKHFVFDSGRVPSADLGLRSTAEENCNLKRVKFGPATANPPGEDWSTTDAWFWFWPPGHSDGCGGIAECTSIETDRQCNSAFTFPEYVPGAPLLVPPTQGVWFPEYFRWIAGVVETPTTD